MRFSSPEAAFLRRLTLVAAAALPFVAASCDEDSLPPAETSGRFYGRTITVGNGTARSYVTLDKGVPVELGIALSEASMQGLPGASGNGQGHEMMTEYLLPLPEQAKTFTPYRLVELDWNPMGHEPPGIYDLPHFDFHFYTITEAERNAIDPTDARFEEKAANVPAADYVPQGYILPAPVAIPRMGTHWIDPTSPELNGATFTTTFIMGSWDGRMTFTEPMITRAFLMSQPNFTGQIAQPAKFVTPGYRPTQYSIEWDAQTREIRVALQSFVNHQ